MISKSDIIKFHGKSFIITQCINFVTKDKGYRIKMQKLKGKKSKARKPSLSIVSTENWIHNFLILMVYSSFFIFFNSVPLAFT